MRKYAAVFVAALISASCSSTEKGLLEADARSITEPRKVLQKALAGDKADMFVYYDRKSNTVYSDGVRIRGFRFRPVDISKLRTKRPEVVRVAECSRGKPCSSSMFEECKAVVGLASPLTSEMQRQFAHAMKARGYPAINISFNETSDTQEVEVNYFTECEFIESDIREVLSSAG